MYPLVRLVTTVVTSLRAPAIEPDAVCETRFRCRPWDLDFFGEMNNGRVLTLYDLGRFDLAIRTGLARVLRRERWGLVVAGGSVRYRRRIKSFDLVTVRTRFSGLDERWFYIDQSMWVDAQPASSILLRTGITSAGRTVPSARVLEVLGAAEGRFDLPEWTQRWADLDAQRPWPP